MRGLAVSGLGPTAKVWRRGTHRVVAPEQTLEHVVPLTKAMGITRVGMLTGLDRIGLPVAMAVRPNGRALAVAQGKGVTSAAAKVSAIMEAAEAFHAEAVTGPLRRAAFRELSDAVDPLKLPRAAFADASDPAAARFLWIAGTDLGSGCERWVPYELIHADYTVPAAEPARFQATTSGLAAGNVEVEAQLHALYEAIERDAIACWREGGGPGSAGRALDLAATGDDEIAALLDRITAAEIDVAAWDVTSDIGIATVIALLLPKGTGADAVEAELGSGCHLDPDVALSRALTEAAQTRLTRISGARDDFEPRSYGSEVRRRRRVEAREWLALARRRPVPWAAFRDGLRRHPSEDLDADLGTVLAGLNAAGFDEVVWVDLARPDIGLPVGRIVVPGLEGPWLPGLYTPGERARARRG